MTSGHHRDSAQDLHQTTQPTSPIPVTDATVDSNSSISIPIGQSRWHPSSCVFIVVNFYFRSVFLLGCSLYWVLMCGAGISKRDTLHLGEKLASLWEQGLQVGNIYTSYSVSRVWQMLICFAVYSIGLLRQKGINLMKCCNSINVRWNQKPIKYLNLTKLHSNANFVIYCSQYGRVYLFIF